MNTSSPSTSILRFPLAFYLGCFNDFKQKLPFLSLPYNPGNSPVSRVSKSSKLWLLPPFDDKMEKKNALLVELKHLSLEHG